MAEKILLVDDQPKNIQVAGSLLTSRGYAVEFATDGPGALKWLQEGGFDLVLLDVMMPGMDGFETCRRFKELEGASGIPVIFLTARTDTESILKGFKAGGVDYITKPFHEEELLMRVQTHLEMKKMRDKLSDLNKWLQAEVAMKTLELSEVNQELQETLGKVENLDKSKDNFLRIISHEIRTPLNGIIGASSLLRSMITDPEQEEFFKMLEISLHRLENFSFAALQITELQARSSDLSRTSVDVAEMIEEAALITHIGEHRLFVKDLAGINPPLQANKVLMVTALVKLFDNAIRYSPQGSEVRVEVKPQTDGIRFRITDRGPGFSPEVLSEKFGLFVTGVTHTDMNPGMSLTLVKFIIGRHGGKIDLFNHPEHGGALVEFYLPWL